MLTYNSDAGAVKAWSHMMLSSLGTRMSWQRALKRGCALLI